MYLFGSGVMTITPAGATPTPINIGLLQEGQITAKSTVKELFGQYRDPLAIGAGTRKWTGKAKVARFSANVLNAIYFGGTINAGMTTTAYEADTIPGTGPYTVTVANATHFTADLGVIYAATGLPFKRVASVSAVGQYSVNTTTGVYTFDAADTGLGVIISYNWTNSTTGQNIVIPQALIGPTLTFGINFTGVDPTNNNVFTGQFWNAVCTDFDFSTKLEDFSMPDFQFSLFVNAAGSIGTYNFPDLF